jgi:hypothetical protein
MISCDDFVDINERINIVIQLINKGVLSNLDIKFENDNQWLSFNYYRRQNIMGIDVF